ncbi:MAG: riboflavin synthase [Gudongella sp.]|nr:riboflavin synthase [Gudongella sp.]
MFTGIIEEIGSVKAIMKSAKGARISIDARKVLEDVKLGDSICTNGVCLTVTDFSDSNFTVDVMAETIRRSNLGVLSPGAKVNLERAMKASDRFGGHIVSGHIDGTGKIIDLQKEDNAVWVTISAESEVLKYIISKGSIAIDGISLTVAYVDDSSFKASIIPHTKEETTLLRKQVGDAVNLECDLVGKYIEKLMNYGTDKHVESGIDMDFLRNNGFA